MISLISLLAGTLFSVTTTNVYVDPHGSDANDGSTATISTSGTVGPVKTIGAALTVLHTLRPVPSAGPAVIFLAHGEYQQSSYISLGTLDSNLTIQGAGEGQTYITGETAIHGWTKYVAGTSPVNINPAIANYVVTAPMPVTAVNYITRGPGGVAGQSLAQSSGPTELIYNGQIQQLSTWPSVGYAHITAVSTDYNTLTFDQSRRVTSWQNGYIGGWWACDNQYDLIALTGAPALNQITHTHNINYLPAVGGRVQIFGLPEDLNAPGQYCFDYAHNTIYFYPPNAPAVLSQLELTTRITTCPNWIIWTSGANNLELTGLTVRGGRGQGIQFNNQSNSGIYNVEVEDTNDNAIEVINSPNTSISHCSIHDAGTNGIFIDSSNGSNVTLTSGGIVLDHNEIYRTNRIEYAGHGGIYMEGNGSIITNNSIHDESHFGIIFNGCNHYIHGNDLNRVITQTTDAGAIYDGRNPLDLGNVIDGNVIRNLNPIFNSAFGNFKVGVYLDDLLSGTTITNNIFYNVPTGVEVGGGRNNIIQGNIFSGNISSSIQADSRGIGFASGYYATNGNFDQFIAGMTTAQRTLFTSTYPTFAAYFTTQNLDLPENNVFSYNIFCNPSNIAVYIDAPTQALLSFVGNTTNGDTVFKNPALGDFSLNETWPFTIPKAVPSSGI